ncbi:hypothetical protein Pmani_006660 [Petrolisthes manimaculis]|uniref:Uncharacterized protein n=1 Tax=Petrolisthes manimaculis TaxID=1843537 RepID=A0AAE1UKW4_9EUCA|nr:hypothetical protein Pmani_006660 [Petrolisthes manimaculis]
MTSLFPPTHTGSCLGSSSSSGGVSSGSSSSLPHDYGLYYDQDYYYDSGEDETAIPTFIARPQSFTVEVGQSVIIPCDAQDQG